MAYLGNAPVVGDSTNSFRLLDDIASFTVTFDATDTSVVSISGDTLSFTNHRFVTGQKVTYTDGGGTAIGGLTDGTSYFIIKVDQNTIKLATNASNAASSTAIDLTSGAAGGSHTLKVAFDGVNTKFKATFNNGKKAKISRAGQISLSINGVIQQPQDSSSPSVGYGVEADSTIVFSTAPVATDKVFATFIGEVAASFDIEDNTIDNFTGDGSTTIFNLSKEVPSSQDVLVTLDGVTQHPSDASTTRSYSVVNQSLTFVSAPATGVAIQARHIGFAGATTSAVTGFYGRTGNAALKSTDDISVQNISGVGATFTSNVNIEGVLTYEDVTNVDSIGIITARAGVLVGSGITLSKDGDVFFTGIATGNGSGLTALNATQLTSGTVPTARLGSGTASSSTFLRGDSTFAAVTSTTINSNADNRVITGSDTANTLNGESNLTFDGTDLSITGSANVAGTLILQPGGTAWSTTNTRPQLGRQSDGELRLGAGSDSSSIITLHTSPSAGGTLVERVRIFKNGDVGIGTATMLGDSKVHINDSSLSNYRSLVLESVATNGSTMIYRQNGAQVLSVGSGGGNNLSGSNITHGLIRSEVASIFAVGNSEKLRITTGGQVNIGGNFAQTNSTLFVQGGSGGDGIINLLELKHANTSTSTGGGTGDGPGLLLNGYYSGAEWQFAKICSVNSGSGFGADLQVHVHPSNGSQGASLVKALSVLGDGTGANVTITDGNLKIGTDGHGIDFSAAGNAGGMSSELLDDYEEGTFTTSVVQGLGTLSATYDSTGRYTKIGRYVYVQAIIQFGGVGNGTTVFLALPFTHVTSTALGGGVISFTNVAGLQGESTLTLIGVSGQSYCQVKNKNTNPSISGTQNNQAIYYHFHYEAA